MNGLNVKQPLPDIKPPACPISLNWKDNLDIQKLLDVISEIIANEYLEIAKQNKNVFLTGGKSCQVKS